MPARGREQAAGARVGVVFGARGDVVVGGAVQEVAGPGIGPVEHRARRRAARRNIALLCRLSSKCGNPIQSQLRRLFSQPRPKQNRFFFRKGLGRQFKSFMQTRASKFNESV